MIALSNISYSNSIYSVSTSNPSGTLTINQATTKQFYLQYETQRPSTVFIGDATSNISLTIGLSNLLISNQSSNLFSVSNITPYLQSNQNFNILTLNTLNGSLLVGINNSNLVRINNSNEIPQSYDNSCIKITGSNAVSFKNIVYEPIGVIDTAIKYTKPIKASSISCSNVSSSNINQLSNVLYSSSNQLYNQTNSNTSNITNLQTSIAWSSNNLLNKSTGGAITGNLGIGGTPSFPLEITKTLTITSNDTQYISILSNLGGINEFTGIHLHTGDWGTQSLLLYSGGTYTNGRGIIQAKDTLNVRNSPNPLLLNPIGGSVGIGLCNPTSTLDVNGTVNATTYTGATITSLSNLGLFGSNTAISASNTTISLSNYVYGTNTTNITNAQTTANWASNVGLFGSNLARNNSNILYPLSNQLYTTTSTNITTAQTTANWASNAGLFGSNVSVYSSNQIISLSNSYYTSTTSQTAINSSNTAYWSSNNLVKKSGDTITGNLNVTGLINTNTIQNNVGVTNFKGEYDMYYTADYDGNNGGATHIFNSYSNERLRITPAGNVGIGTNNPQYKLDVAGSINASNYTGATITSLSNLGLFSSNSVVSTSNTTFLLSNYVYGSNTSNITNAQTTANWASNAGLFSSNLSVYSSNSLISLSNYTYCNLTTTSNYMYSNIPSLCNFITSVSNYSYVNLPYLNSSYSSLSNYTYNLSTSNSTLCNVFTTNVYTKTVNATDGGSLGALVVGATGLALGGYNLFNNSGKLTNALTDSLGKINIDPSTGIANFIQGLFGYGRFTDAVDIGVATITLSNNSIYFKNSNTSNTIYTSNAINVINSNISTFTISNANLYTNCNISACNISLLSNATYWCSNNLINKSGDAFIGNVGIGGSPSLPLEITKSLNITSNDTTYISTLCNLGGINSFTGTLLRNGDHGTQSMLMYAGGSYTNGRGIIQCKDILNVRNSPNPLLLNPIGGSVGIGCCNPAYTLDVNGTINATSYVGTTITNLSNLGVFGSNTSTSASNNVIALSNYVYGTNTTNITNAQTTANWASNAGLFGSNTSISLSNYVYGTTTTNITNAQTTAIWASNASVFGSNLARNNSNVLYPLSNQLYTTTTTNITNSQTTANWSSNASVFSSNNVVSLSNAYYTSSTNSTAISASNTAYWSSNNINWNQLQNKPFQVWKSDWLGGSVNSIGYYKIATLADVGGGVNGTGIEINGWCGGFGAEKMSFKCLVKSRSGVSMKGYTQGTYQSNYDVLLYQETDGTFSLYFYNGDYFTSWLFEINSDTTYGATLLTPSGTKTTPTGTLNTKMSSNLVMVASGNNVGIGTSNPQYKFDVSGTTHTTSLLSTVQNANISTALSAYPDTSIGITQLASGGITSCNLGRISWFGYNRATPTASISVDTNGSYEDQGWIRFATSSGAGGNLSEKMCISHVGNVGVGTNNPTKGRLECAGVISTNQAGEARYHLFNNGGVAEWKFGQKTSSSHNFIVSKSVNNFDYDYLAIDTSGNVGVGLSNPSYKLDVAGDILARNAWIRTSGNSGWYNETYGGGFYMTDTTWIRTYNAKNLFHDGSIMRTDGQLHIGNGGSTFLCSNGGDFSYRANVLYANTSGNVGIGTSNPSQKLDVVGNINSSSNITASNSLGVGTTLPLYNFDCRGNMQVRGSATKYAFMSITDSNLSAEVRITAHSNQNSYLEYYGDLYFKKIGLGGTTTNPSVLSFSSNGNIGIGTSNNLTKLAIKGQDNTYTNGGHIECYGTDTYPIYQHLNYNHDNSAMCFDSYWNGSGWISSSSTNNYQIYKLGGGLQFNEADGVTAGSSIAWSNVMTLSNGTVYSKYINNAGSISTSNLSIAGGTYLTYYRVMTGISIGTTSSISRSTSVSFGAYGNPPNTQYNVMLDYRSDNNDVFAGKVVNRTTTGFDIITCRIDAIGWATSPNVNITIIGY